MTTKLGNMDNSSDNVCRKLENGLFLAIYEMLDASLNKKLTKAVLWNR